MQVLRTLQFLTYGYINFGQRGYQLNQKTFTPDALDVDLTGRHYIVTGATSGLGKVTAKEFASRGGTVHLVCRDETRGAQVRQAIIAETGNPSVETHICDISSLSDVDEFTSKWRQSGRSIAALVNNAGGIVHQLAKSKDGYETNFATNTLGTFYLTEMLRPCLEGARVVTVSSGGMLTEPLEINDLEGVKLSQDDRIDGTRQYARGKRHQVALTEWWGRKDGWWAASMHPGWAGTPGLEKSMPGFYNATKSQLRTQEQGADTIVYLAVAKDVVHCSSGQFFFDRQPVEKHLWASGTRYKEEDVEKLVRKLRGMVEAKGFKFLD